MILAALLTNALLISLSHTQHLLRRETPNSAHVDLFRSRTTCSRVANPHRRSIAYPSNNDCPSMCKTSSELCQVSCSMQPVCAFRETVRQDRQADTDVSSSVIRPSAQHFASVTSIHAHHAHESPPTLCSCQQLITKCSTVVQTMCCLAQLLRLWLWVQHCRQPGHHAALLAPGQ
jgi:hypothetical protein